MRHDRPDAVVTQLTYDSDGDLTSSSTPDGNSGGEVAKTTYAYDADGEKTSSLAPDGNLSGANAGNFTTSKTYNADGEITSVTVGAEAARPSCPGSPPTPTTGTATGPAPAQSSSVRLVGSTSGENSAPRSP